MVVVRCLAYLSYVGIGVQSNQIQPKITNEVTNFSADFLVDMLIRYVSFLSALT